MNHKKELLWGLSLQRLPDHGIIKSGSQGLGTQTPGRIQKVDPLRGFL